MHSSNEKTKFAMQIVAAHKSAADTGTTLQNNKSNTYQKTNYKHSMKKNYTQPTIEIAEVALEMGIAMSIPSAGGIEDIYLTEEDVIW